MAKPLLWEDFTRDEQRYLRLVSQYFRQKGQWPNYKYLERELRLHDPDYDFDTTVAHVNAKVFGQSTYMWNPAWQETLNMRVLAICPDMEEELTRFLEVLRYCANIYDSDTGDGSKPITVEFTQLFVALKWDQALLVTAINLLQNEVLFSAFHGDQNNPLVWSFTLSEDMRKYRGAKTIDQYLAIRYPDTTTVKVSAPSQIDVPAGADFGTSTSTEIFVVHGHDEAARESVARYLADIGLRPIILHEQANSGQTIIEKFEKHSAVSFAVVLLTPDDVGAPTSATPDLKQRARQNVILEWGYFVGRLGRNHVCALKKRDVELPSDMQGLLWTEMDEAGAWKSQLYKELQAAKILASK